MDPTYIPTSIPSMEPTTDQLKMVKSYFQTEALRYIFDGTTGEENGDSVFQLAWWLDANNWGWKTLIIAGMISGIIGCICIACRCRGLPCRDKDFGYKHKIQNDPISELMPISSSSVIRRSTDDQIMNPLYGTVIDLKPPHTNNLSQNVLTAAEEEDEKQVFSTDTNNADKEHGYDTHIQFSRITSTHTNTTNNTSNIAKVMYSPMHII